MKELPSKRAELKVISLQDLENILPAGVCVHFLGQMFLFFLQAWAVKVLSGIAAVWRS